MTSNSPWLQRTGIAIVVVSAVGTGTSLGAVFFPALALSSLGYELWIGALAWHWLRDRTC